MKTLNLAVVVLITSFGGLTMIDGIMTGIGNELFPLSVFKALVGFIFVLASGLFLKQTQLKEE